MTGLFRRLARQVVGPQPIRVHAMARLPFVPPPESPVAADPGMDTTDSAAPASSPTPAPTVQAPTEHVQTSVPAARRSGPSPAATHASPPAITAPTAADAAAPEPVRAEPRHRPPPTQTRETIEKVETLVVAPGAGGRPPAAPAVETPAAIASAADKGPDALFTLPPTANDPGVTIPPPLLNTHGGTPQTHIAAAAAAMPPGARDGRDAQPGNTPAAAGEPTEVHVHIGRIEVTAVSEAAPVRGRPRAGKEPMSLQEYLSQRQRGRP